MVSLNRDKFEFNANKEVTFLCFVYITFMIRVSVLMLCCNLISLPLFWHSKDSRTLIMFIDLYNYMELEITYQDH